MVITRPSESAIESAVERLKKSPGVFQRLAENYAQLVYPQRFKNLIPKGRKASDVTIKGWPDAYTLLPDGRVDVVEATHSPKWQSHLKKDLDRATKELEPGQLGGILFIAWAPTPPVELVQGYRDRFVDLGAPAEKVTFVFKQQLVRELSWPRFARLWVDFLQLHSDCYPFQFINTTPIFGPGLFAPSIDEYRDGVVHQPHVTDEVEAYLERQGWALVRGLGAAGKTVLATLIALGDKFGHGTAYYLDLVEFSEELVSVHLPTVLEAITTRADDHVLFIVDNVHLNEKFARSLFVHWKSVSSGSCLLMLGRWVSPGPDVRGLSRPLGELEPAVITLEAGPDDLAGIFRRLARRHIATTANIPQPPQEALHNWDALFGGDLVAFSAAVARRINQLLRGDWRLRAEHAVDYVWETYLEPITERERRNLLHLAALAELELDVPAAALEPGGLRSSVHTGLVHRLRRGQGEYEWFHLIHPGIGRLLLAATQSPVDKLKMRVDVAQRAPFYGLITAARLEAFGQKCEASAVLKSIVRSQRQLLDAILTPGLQRFRLKSQLLVRLEVLSEVELDQRLRDERAALAATALRTPLHFLVSFLKYAKRQLPEVHTAVSTALAKEENLETLSETALRTPLHFLVSFLKYAKRQLPEVHTAVSTALAKEENLETLSETALRTPLHFLVSFLKYAKRQLPEVHTAVSTALAKEENLETLSETALRTPLHFLVSFLKYAKRQLPEVYTAVSTALAKEENLETLSETALRTSLGDLASFLEYVSGELPNLGNALNARLAEPNAIEKLTAVACHSPLDGLLAFLRTAAIAHAVVAAINQDAWEKTRLAMRSEQPDFLPHIADRFHQLGRPELAEVPACTLIIAAEPCHWHVQSITLSHISHTLRLGHAAGTEEILRFLDLIATEDWLEKQYTVASPGAIAAALFSLWGYHDEEVLVRFCTEALRARVTAEIRKASTLSTVVLSGVLQLLGCSALLGLDVAEIQVEWPDIKCQGPGRFPRSGVGYVSPPFLPFSTS